MYSQKQMSGITTRSGAARLAPRTMRATRPSRFQASLPDASLWCEMPNSISAFTPSRARPSTTCSQLALGDAGHARHLGDRQRFVDALLDEDRLDQVVGGDGGLAHQVAQRRRIGAGGADG